MIDKSTISWIAEENNHVAVIKCMFSNVKSRQKDIVMHAMHECGTGIKQTIYEWKWVELQVKNVYCSGNEMIKECLSMQD